MTTLDTMYIYRCYPYVPSSSMMRYCSLSLWTSTMLRGLMQRGEWDHDEAYTCMLHSKSTEFEFSSARLT